MKKWIIILTSLFGVFLYASCDPSRVLVVKAVNKPNYSVTIYANENVLPGHHPYHQDSVAKKIVIRIPTIDTIAQREKIFLYGLGGWGVDSLMASFSKNIDSIIILNDGSRLKLDTPSSIHEYLLKNRSGFAKRKLTIEAK